MTTAGTDEQLRVSTLELFFDLVFVFVITQLATVLVDEPNLRGLAQVVLMLGVIWWMYGGYAWLTNAVPPDRASRRAILLAGMASFLMLALSIPRAFGDAAAAFGIAYVGIVAVHTLLFLRASSRSVAHAILQIAPFNAVTAGLVLAGGLAGGTAQYVLWAIAGVGGGAAARCCRGGAGGGGGGGAGHPPRRRGFRDPHRALRRAPRAGGDRRAGR